MDQHGHDVPDQAPMVVVVEHDRESDILFRDRILGAASDDDRRNGFIHSAAGARLDEFGRKYGLHRRAHADVQPRVPRRAQEQSKEQSKETDTPRIMDRRSMEAEGQKRRYLPTLADLVDALTIYQQKMVFIPEKRDEFARRVEDIEHDLGLLLAGLPPLGARQVRAMLALQLANRVIWEHEFAFRAGDLKDTEKIAEIATIVRTVNGVRNTMKNVLSEFDAGNVDHKVDCMAADLPAKYGNWRIL